MKREIPLMQLAEINISYSSKIKLEDRIKISDSAEAAKLFRQIWSDQIQLREEFNILLLSRANAVLGWYNVSKGGTSGTVVDPKLIFSTALKCNAHGLIMAHNHPSGNLQPSEADIALTKKIKGGCLLLDMQLLDHLIITSESYFSFTDDVVI